ncbi:MAG: alpha,2-mannosyltransferase [Chloroflexota bacterium]|nr:alpha,2-mannosyltransferase [Chloroflexota bacterium]
MVAIATIATLVTRGDSGMFNDFYDYWGAARVLLGGGNPYDISAIAAAVHGAGVDFESGRGYSYPALFAFAMAPLGLLPPRTAAWVFTGLSMAGLLLAVTILASPLARLRAWELVLLGGLCGWFTATRGTIFFGQANLLVLPLLAVAYRGVARPGMVALAAAVKLYPAAGALPLLFRRGDLRPLLASVAAGLGLIVVPNLVVAALPGGGVTAGARLASFFDADPFWTNQSVNGWISRLALAGDYTAPPLPGLDTRVAMLAVVGILAVALVVVLMVTRGAPWDGCFALALGFAVVAAPKNSLWNYMPLLLAVFFCWPRVRRRPVAFVFLAVGFGLVQLQSIIDTTRDTFYGFQPGMTWLSSLALYGALVVCGLTAYLLLTEPPLPGDRRASP